MVIYLWEVQLWIIFHTLHDSQTFNKCLLGTDLGTGKNNKQHRQGPCSSRLTS